MADPDDAVQRALNAVDRRRRWTIAALIAGLAVMAVSLGVLFAAAASAAGKTPNGAVLKALFTATITEMFFVACCTIAVLLHLSRLAKAMMQAMERPGE